MSEMLFFRKDDRSTRFPVSCRLCEDRKFAWHGGSLTAHGRSHVRHGEAKEAGPWGTVAELRFVVCKGSEAKRDRQITLDFDSDRRRDIARLIPLAQELAIKAADRGITVASLRTYAVSRGILTGEERGRRLSFLGVVMKKAGLVATDEYRRSHIDRSHGNLHRVFVQREFAQRRAS